MLRLIDESSPVIPYLKPRVLLILLLGFSSGLPLALSGSTLAIWMKELDVDLTTIGLFSLVGLPYTFKFFWAPVVDAISIPYLTERFGRRRSWLIATQLALMAAIVFMGSLDPLKSPFLIALGAVIVASISATQDIVIDAYRIEALPTEEQAAGVAYYVSAYRVAMLVSTAGVIALVAWLEIQGVSSASAWFYGFAAAAALVVVGLIGALFAGEPNREAFKASSESGVEDNALKAFFVTAWEAFSEFLQKPQIVTILLFVVLFKFCDALAGVMTGPFVLDIGFDKVDYAAIVKGVGLAATLIGTFAAGGVAYSVPLHIGLWIAALTQMFSNLVFVWLAMVGPEHWVLVSAIIIENFTSAFGNIIFIVYLSALCGNTLHTATQYAVLAALTSFGRTFLSASSGAIADQTGWITFFVITTAAAVPALMLLVYLQANGHFGELDKEKEAEPQAA